VPMLAQTITQTGTFAPGAADVLQKHDGSHVQFFQSAGAPAGAVLDSVSVSVSFTETVGASRTRRNDAILHLQTTAHFSIGGSLPVATENTLRAGLR